MIDKTTAIAALEKGLDDLMDLCDVVSEKFTAARDTFDAEQGNQMAV
jgi:DNA-directed RNA polymerases I and III subunit RPAC2